LSDATDNHSEEPTREVRTTPDDGLHFTPTYYDLLAEEIMQDLDRAAAKIPKLEARHHAPANAIRAHVNVPVKFLGTAVAVTEDTAEIKASVRLVPADGLDTLQYMDAFRRVDDKLGAIRAYVRFTLVSRKTVLAVQALRVYAVARSRARDQRDARINAHVENLRRDLGNRGRPKKKKGEEPA
jgi:hypothetical protein